MSYYPTKVGRMHPGLGGRDLLGEQIEALHRRSIRCPIFLTVAWDEWTADLHRDWLQFTGEGQIAQARNQKDDGTIDPGGWRYVNWLRPNHGAFLEAPIDELFDAYAVNGLFFNILSFAPDCCWSDHSIRFRKRHGLLDRSHASLVKFRVLAQNEISAKLTAKVRSRSSVACPQIGILLAGVPGMVESHTARSESGAMMLAEETHHDCAVLDDASELSGFELIVLPDSTPITVALRTRLAAYHQAGGKLLLTGSAGCDEAGEVLCCDPVIKQVVDATTGEPLPRIAPGCFGLRGKGRLLLQIPNYFGGDD